MTRRDKMLKRGFDLIFALIGLWLLWPIILLCWVIAWRDTGANGFFFQTRIGQGGRPFRVVKLRTMRQAPGPFVTTAQDTRITAWGARLRRWKLDELPQLWNVLWGQMSFVGPRPDVPGYSDRLEGDDRRLLSLRPGITGPATLKYRDEESLLAAQTDPQTYNDQVIWPDKVAINLRYLDGWSFRRDLSYILETVRG